MGRLERRVLEALGVVNWVEIDAAELYSELQRKRLLEEADQGQFPEVPVPFPPSQLAEQISSRADRQQLTVTEVLSCAIEEERRAQELNLQVAGNP
ncbi:MAG: hypothetical protein ABSA59_22420 [Terriglobia bacterium]|jgi:hypothetical protein